LGGSESRERGEYAAFYTKRVGGGVLDPRAIRVMKMAAS
jgi:predicted phage gp36 major capsid-like protein